MKFRLILFAAAALNTIVFSAEADAAPLRDVPLTVTQPDGRVLDLLASGDEFLNWLHDGGNHIIVQDPVDGFYVYADVSEGLLRPTRLVVGEADPAATNIPSLAAPPARLWPSAAGVTKAGILPRADVPTDPRGQINNIVVFIRFSDEQEPGEPVSVMDAYYNDDATGSMTLKRYFRESSFGLLSLSSIYLPTPVGENITSYQDANPRKYYSPYNATTNPIGYKNDSESYTREMSLLKNALDAVKDSIPSDLDVDHDKNGYVDSVTFVVTGMPDAWADLLWPHMWELGMYEVKINGSLVKNYDFQLRSVMLVATLVHEMFHVFGSPDLYHYSYDGLAPVWIWDVMGSSTIQPVQTSAYMKNRYMKWIETIPEITKNGLYTLSSVMSATNNAYKIRSPVTDKEYFVLEYRNKDFDMDGVIPDSGLLVYRINTEKDGVGNRLGPPDEVYIYRPGGTLTVDGDSLNACFSENVKRTEFTDATDPTAFLSSGGQGWLYIYNIGQSKGTISFRVVLFGCPGKQCGTDGFGASCGDCSTEEQCMAADCSEAGRCSILPKAKGASCEDGKPCTTGEQCDGKGACKGGNAYSCTPNQCESESNCDGKGGCTPVFKPTTDSCSTGDPKSIDDHCDGNGLCVSGGVQPGSDGCSCSAVSLGR